ncbi:Type 1 glutamine amidotransferase-like domain-containing protein [Candidatus Woesearchaeota archaeon]|nr:Type 1 glutamine amidotransferase-like domain-containing protein [Candidatus Woesearchaeota archaeon]
MAQTLLLTSAGIVPEVRDSFISLLPKKLSEITVAFVTTAAYGETKNPAWLEKDRQLLYGCGIQHIEDLDLKDKTPAALEMILSKKDVLFVNGGNTFYLLHWVRKSGFGRVLSHFLKRGGIYVGVSAGSYIACPTIEAATWKHQDRNRVGMTDFTALHLVPFLITAHFEEKYRVIINQATQKTDHPIVALTDRQAIMVHGKEAHLIGTGKLECWNGFHAE